jgi:hemerythrin-like domain-containing protein
MKPIGALMKEHRLIERMISIMEEELYRIQETNTIEVRFIDDIVDFLRTYTDRTHHGKEEDILLRDLGKKQLSEEHKKMINFLVEDHIRGRKLGSSLASARERYMLSDADSLKDIKEYIKELTRLYPLHIEKEDKQFFGPCMKYFTKQEQDKMLQEFREFDRQLIHRKYDMVVGQLEKERQQA